MKYDDMLAAVMDGSMGYLPNDGMSYSLLVKKIYDGKPCDCIFFYVVSKGTAKGPRRVLLFDGEKKRILADVDDVGAYFHTDKVCECTLERRDIGSVLKLEADYKAAYTVVSDFAFQKELDDSQRKMAKELLWLLQEHAGVMYGMYQLAASEFIGWLNGEE